MTWNLKVKKSLDLAFDKQGKDKGQAQEMFLDLVLGKSLLVYFVKLWLVDNLLLDHVVLSIVMSLILIFLAGWVFYDFYY